jgi:hypothetical protein
MALNAGDETVAPGTLAAAIYEGILAAAEGGSALDPEATPEELAAMGEDEAEAAQKRFAAAIAQAVVDHIVNNAEITITVPADGIDAGLPADDEDFSGVLA